jgi:hypothetical protein
MITGIPVAGGRQSMSNTPCGPESGLRTPRSALPPLPGHPEMAPTLKNRSVCQIRVELVVPWSNLVSTLERRSKRRVKRWYRPARRLRGALRQSSFDLYFNFSAGNDGFGGPQPSARWFGRRRA